MHLSEVETTKSVQGVDKKLWPGFATQNSFHLPPWVLKAAQIVMIDHFDTASVPNAALKGVPTQGCLTVTAVLDGEWRLLPAVELDRMRLLAPRCFMGVSFRKVPG